MLYDDVTPPRVCPREDYSPRRTRESPGPEHARGTGPRASRCT